MNKNYLLLGLAFAAGITQADAQQRLKFPANLGPKVPAAPLAGRDAGPGQHSKAAAAKTGSGNSTSASYGTQIGQTYYDLQSNGAPGNRIKRDANGNISTVWTMECTAGTTAWPGRGAGYNHFDGTSWTSGATGNCPGNFGIFTVRMGWPEITIFPSGKELAVGHAGAGLIQTSRPNSTATWATSTAPAITSPAGLNGEGDTWTGMVSVGSNVYMVAAGFNLVANGVQSGISYYRSTDEGTTWNEIGLPGHDSVTTFPDGLGGDNYALHANGNTVAIVAGSGGSDWVMWKSTDAGLTFTKTTIRDFADAPNQWVIQGTDTLYETNDQLPAVVVDYNGNVHAFAGYLLSAIDGNGDYSGYYPLSSEGIWYWTDMVPGMIPKLAADAREDVPGVNWIGNGSYLTPAARTPYFNGELSMPNAAVTPNNDIYLVYSGLVEGTSNTGDSTGQSFRDLYAIKIVPGTLMVSEPKNISNEIANAGRTDFEEDVFPSVAHEIGADNLLHMIWQFDLEPGLNVRGDLDTEGLNEIMYYSFDVTAQNWDMYFLSTNEQVSEHFNSISAMPNPTTGVAQLNLDLKQGADVSVKVTNILGQEVMNVKSSFMNAGANTMKLDLSKQADGVYLYTVTADGFSVTNRIVKQ